MTYPGRVDVVGSLLNKGGQCAKRTQVYPSSAKYRKISLPKPATANLDGAHANPRNLMGFLDAFKAILAFCTTSPGASSPSLTRCEDFA
jgi:hypothetical protein